MVHNKNKHHYVYSDDEKKLDELITYLNVNDFNFSGLKSTYQNYSNKKIYKYGMWIYPDQKKYSIIDPSESLNLNRNNVGSIEETYHDELRLLKIERVINNEKCD